MLPLARAPSAEAAVGEGDVLPEGAKQEDRLRKGIEAWKKQGVKLTTTEVTDDEWTNTQGFLRRLYTLEGDMGYLSRGFGKDKRRKAEELITTFKKRVKQADKPAKAKDVEKFMAFHAEITGYLDAFSEMLSDAPQELELEPEDVSIV
uniref:Uncharacterized protein n=1 Tax=Pyrodinium bahamense TaxID=73915 RepID=A0A7S0B7D4_9DINO